MLVAATVVCPETNVRPLTHAPEIGAINSSPDSGASFSCRRATSNVIDCLRGPKAVNDVRSCASARKTGAGILRRIWAYGIAWIDMSINMKKSSCIRVGPRYNSLCCNLTTSDGHEILWTNKLRYLGVYLVSSKALSCNYNLIKKVFLSCI